jgi:hypothetical protein
MWYSKTKDCSLVRDLLYNLQQSEARQFAAGVTLNFVMTMINLSHITKQEGVFTRATSTDAYNTSDYIASNVK